MSTRPLHAISIAAALVSASQAQTFWWDGSAGPQAGGSDPQDRDDAHQWNNDANWSGNSAGTTTGDTPIAGEDAIFNIDGLNSNFVIHLNNSSREVGSVTFASTGNIQFIRDNNPPGTGARYLEVGSAITLGTNSGSVTFGPDGSDGFFDFQEVGVEALTTSLSIANNSSSALTFNGVVRADSPLTDPTSITLSGTGSGGVIFNNQINNGSGGAVVSLGINRDANSVTTLNVASGYTGGTTLDQGILVLGQTGALGSGDLNINGGRLGVASGGITLANNLVVGGDFAIGTESAISGSSSGFSGLNGNIDLGGGTREITIRRTTAISGIISNGGLSFVGVDAGDSPSATRQLILTGNNTYSGTTTITSGRLQIGDGGTSGTLGSGDVINNGVLSFDRSNTYGIGNNISGSGSLELTAGGGDSSLSGTNSYTGGTTISGGRFRVSSDASLGAVGGALTLDGGSLKNSGGPLTLDAGRSVILGGSGGGFQAGWSSDLTVNGVVSGSGGLTVQGDSGTLVLAGANTYTGDTAVTDSSSRLKVTGSLGSGSSYAGEISGAGSVEFAGSGTQTLTGTSASHNGTTMVTGGATLVVNGSLTSSLTTVETGSTIGGSGTVGALTVNSGASHNPGNSPGQMTIAGDYNLAGELNIEIVGAGGLAGTDFDQLIVNGGVDLDGSSMLVTSFSGAGYAVNDELLIILNDGADSVTGSFSGLAEGAVVANHDSLDWEISYVAGDGNDVGLIAVAPIPEPRVALLAALGALALLRRRRP